MRLWHLIFAVFLVALVLTVAKTPAGRVAVVVFGCGTGVLISGVAGLMMLFQTIGSFGEARGKLEFAQSALATGIVLVVSSGLMVGTLVICIAMVQRVVP